MKNVQERDELRQSIIQQCGGIDGTMVVDVGEYVMVKWSESLILPGLVTEVTDSDDENVQVLSMKKSGDLYMCGLVCVEKVGVLSVVKKMLAGTLSGLCMVNASYQGLSTSLFVVGLHVATVCSLLLSEMNITFRNNI